MFMIACTVLSIFLTLLYDFASFCLENVGLISIFAALLFDR